LGGSGKHGRRFLTEQHESRLALALARFPSLSKLAVAAFEPLDRFLERFLVP
jgi:hypothetical protein